MTKIDWICSSAIIAAVIFGGLIGRMAAEDVFGIPPSGVRWWQLWRWDLDNYDDIDL